MLKKYSLKTLQVALNAALALDDQMPEKIQALDNKVLQLIINPLQTQFFMVFTKKEILLLDEYEGDIDTTIQSNPLGLIRLSILPSSQARSLFNDQVHLSGDVALGQQVKELFESLDIDWEGHLAQFTGDVIAYQLGSLVRRGVSFTKQVTHSMSLNLNDYVHEELRLVPPKMELDDFFHEVDEVALEVERLQARINQLLSPQ
jgi:ubiquinone biosynthesis protein UbiJ